MSGFLATFKDGPLSTPENDRHFIGHADPFASLYFVLQSNGWILVGFTGMVPTPPWPQQIRYDLVSASDSDLDDDGGTVAIYEIGSESR
jgi:hypothetical protein